MATSSGANTPDPNTHTYSTMSVGDVEAIGAHCQMPFCHQLDFLPFRCESCKGKFCLDHRSETAHLCSNAGAWARARTGITTADLRATTTPQRPTLLTHEQQCSSPSCKTLINTPLVTGVHCANCNRTYCLKHRFREEHECAKLAPLGARPAAATQRERGLAALEKLRAWGASKQKSIRVSTSRAKESQAARAAASAALKKSAKGDEKVPLEKRVYLHVEASAETVTSKVPSGAFFYNREWSVGRVLDAAAKSLQVQNVNNRVESEEERLRVFHVEAGRLLEFSEKLGVVCQSGNTIVLLRGVGPAVPDLIQT
ncbi:hypothetical protein LTR28_005970 [Elasticomyces elasticus]|nr:hypothetical protein LTR28_005970 [Elasticomyces elasticus]